MNILIVKTTPFAPEGITGVILNLYRAMDKKDMQIDAVAPGRAAKTYRDIFAQNGGKIYRIDRSLLHPFRYIRALKRRIRQGNYDIVHIHGNSRTMALELLAAKLAGCPARIVHGHTTNCTYKFLHKVLSPLFFRLYTQGFACGEKAVNFLFGKRPFTVIPNGIHISVYAFNSVKRQTLRAELGLEDKTVFCTVGRLSPGKNHSFLLDVCKKIAEKREDVHLLCIGDGELRQELEEQAKGLPVTFVGLTDKVAEYLSASDACLLPSLFEGFPLSAMEAQANGMVCYLADTITKDVNVSGNVQYLPLEEKAWLDALLACSRMPDRSRLSMAAAEAMFTQGYDNTKIAEMLNDFSIIRTICY